LIPFVASMDDKEHQDLRTNTFQGEGDDESDPSQNKGPSTRWTLKKIQNGSDGQDPLRPNGIKLPFKLAKEDIKI